MASVLGLFLGGCVTAIPIVTGVAEGVSHQKRQNDEAANQTRMIKFHLDVADEAGAGFGAGAVDGGLVVLRHGKVWVVPQDEATHRPQSMCGPTTTAQPPLHAFCGFYIQYPDEDRSPPQRGLVSTVSDDPPMLNWIYLDADTAELKYGNRTASIAHVVGDWDWTEDESALTLDGWEGFVAVDEGPHSDRDGLRWALYFDRTDDGLDDGRKVCGRPAREVSLRRRVQSEEEQLHQLQEADRKMQVKSQGSLKSHFTAPAARRKNG